MKNNNTIFYLTIGLFTVSALGYVTSFFPPTLIPTFKSSILLIHSLSTAFLISTSVLATLILAALYIRSKSTHHWQERIEKLKFYRDITTKKREDLPTEEEAKTELERFSDIKNLASLEQEEKTALSTLKRSSGNNPTEEPPSFFDLANATAETLQKARTIARSNIDSSKIREWCLNTENVYCRPSLASILTQEMFDKQTRKKALLQTKEKFLTPLAFWLGAPYDWEKMLKWCRKNPSTWMERYLIQHHADDIHQAFKNCMDPSTKSEEWGEQILDVASNALDKKHYIELACIHPHVLTKLSKTINTLPYGTALQQLLNKKLNFSQGGVQSLLDDQSWLSPRSAQYIRTLLSRYYGQQAHHKSYRDLYRNCSEKIPNTYTKQTILPMIQDALVTSTVALYIHKLLSILFGASQFPTWLVGWPFLASLLCITLLCINLHHLSKIKISDAIDTFENATGYFNWFLYSTNAYRTFFIYKIKLAILLGADCTPNPKHQYNSNLERGTKRTIKTLLTHTVESNKWRIAYTLLSRYSFPKGIEPYHNKDHAKNIYRDQFYAQFIRRFSSALTDKQWSEILTHSLLSNDFETLNLALERTQNLNITFSNTNLNTHLSHILHCSDLVFLLKNHSKHAFVSPINQWIQLYLADKKLRFYKSSSLESLGEVELPERCTNTLYYTLLHLLPLKQTLTENEKASIKKAIEQIDTKMELLNIDGLEDSSSPRKTADQLFSLVKKYEQHPDIQTILLEKIPKLKHPSKSIIDSLLVYGRNNNEMMDCCYRVALKCAIQSFNADAFKEIQSLSKTTTPPHSKFTPSDDVSLAFQSLLIANNVIRHPRINNKYANTATKLQQLNTLFQLGHGCYESQSNLIRYIHLSSTKPDDRHDLNEKFKEHFQHLEKEHLALLSVLLNPMEKEKAKAKLMASLNLSEANEKTFLKASSASKNDASPDYHCWAILQSHYDEKTLKKIQILLEDQPIKNTAPPQASTFKKSPLIVGLTLSTVFLTLSILSAASILTPSFGMHVFLWLSFSVALTTTLVTHFIVNPQELPKCFYGKKISAQSNDFENPLPRGNITKDGFLKGKKDQPPIPSVSL